MCVCVCVRGVCEAGLDSGIIEDLDAQPWRKDAAPHEERAVSDR